MYCRIPPDPWRYRNRDFNTTKHCSTMTLVPMFLSLYISSAGVLWVQVSFLGIYNSNLWSVVWHHKLFSYLMNGGVHINLFIFIWSFDGNVDAIYCSDHSREIFHCSKLLHTIVLMAAAPRGILTSCLALLARISVTLRILLILAWVNPAVSAKTFLNEPLA